MSPVGRPPDAEDDGRPGRTYRGKPNPLGVVAEWVCVACGKKNTGNPIEQGCVHCGAGTPGTKHAKVEKQVLPATVQGEAGVGARTETVQPQRPVEHDHVLQPSTDPAQRVYTLFKELVKLVLEEGPRAPQVMFTAPEKQVPMLDPPGNPQTYAPRDQANAGRIIEFLDYRGAYTLALALQMFAEQADMGMEANKQFSAEECLRLAQALMDLIPADWDPQPEEEQVADGKEDSA
jgi:hypothetical protein